VEIEAIGLISWVLPALSYDLYTFIVHYVICIILKVLGNPTIARMFNIQLITLQLIHTSLMTSKQCSQLKK